MTPTTGFSEYSNRHCSGTTLELIVAGCLNGFTDDEVDLMGTLSLLAGRPANWNVLGVSAMSPDRTEHQLAASDTIAARGGRLVALTLPHTLQLRLSFEHGAILDGLPGWREIFGLGKDARIAALRDPETRRRLAEGANSDEAGIRAFDAGRPSMTGGFSGVFTKLEAYLAQLQS